jgi:hypothetical protein
MMTVEKSVAGMERIVIPVSPLVRVGPLDVFVRRQIWRYQISVKSGQAQNAKNNKKKKKKSKPRVEILGNWSAALFVA